MTAQRCDRETLRRLGIELRKAGYTEANLRDRLSLKDEDLGQLFDGTVASFRVGDRRDRLADLIALFYLNRRVAGDSPHLDEDLLARLVYEDILVRDHDEVRAKIRLAPFKDLIVSSDPLSVSSNDQVHGVTSPAARLAAVTVRDPVTTALDLGSGGGIQALLAARHVEKVTAVDVNPRTFWFLEANAALNDLDNITALAGSWFEPVRGKSFDLIVSNPPYTISPDSQFVYRDSGMRGDQLCRTLVREAAAHLNPGGYAHIICDWTEHADQSWVEALRGWVQGLSCDACIIKHSTMEPLRYAALWNSPIRVTVEGDYQATLQRWMSYFVDLGVSMIGHGLIILRRTDRAEPRVLIRDAPSTPRWRVAVGDHTSAIFTAMDSSSASDSDLLLETLMPCPGLTINQSMSYQEEEFKVYDATGSRDPGLGLSCTVNPALIPLLIALDGYTTLGAALDRIAPDGEHQPDFVAHAMSTVREMIALGFISQSRKPA